jgi:polyhydroxyalkanoate synthesis regulator phasin
MAFTGTDETRIEAIENAILDLQKAVSNLASKQQVKQLVLIKQEEIISLTARVTELERLITLIENSI